LINVSVHARRTVKLTLNRVLHKPRGKGFESHGRHSIADLKKMARIVDDILAPQTNVHLTATVRSVKYKGDLGDYLEYSAGNARNRREYDELVTERDAAAKINAYAVNGYRKDGEEQTGSVHTVSTHALHIIFNTRPKGYTDTRLGQLLAHEVCHALLYPWSGSIHLKASEPGLMNDGMLLFAKPGAVGHQDLKLWSGRSKTVYERAAP
jgi:hypothetical protein